MRYPPWYAWAAVVLSTMASAGLSAIVSIQSAERAIEEQAEAQAQAAEEGRRAQAQAAEAGRLATCNVALTQLGIYDVVPPSTKIQREAFRAWTDMAELYRCT